MAARQSAISPAAPKNASAHAAHHRSAGTGYPIAAHLSQLDQACRVIELPVVNRLAGHIGEYLGAQAPVPGILRLRAVQSQPETAQRPVMISSIDVAPGASLVGALAAALLAAGLGFVGFLQ